MHPEVYAAGRMQHNARSWWLDEAGGVTDPRPPLDGDAEADVAIVGGGYTGLWTAWHALAAGADPARVVLLEGDLCGHGPSGRNGGFVEELWLNLPALRRRFGDAAALALCHAAEGSVRAIGAWCEAEEVDAHFERAGHMVDVIAAEHDGAGAEAARAARELGVADRVVPLDRDAVQRRCASPLFRSGVLLPASAKVQPARLALGLRRRLLERGVRIHERTRARRLVERAGAGAEIHTDRGRVRARHAVLAAGGALAGFGPLRGRLTVASSHIVLTEPVPDVLDALGWMGGEAITDSRTLLHYFRTTRDGRIAFGWAGGRLALGGRLGDRVDVDPGAVATAREDLVRTFPQLAGRAITHAWGGPIDIAPSRLATVGTLPGGRVHFAYGYTGNGVGPTHLAGRALASLALDRRDDASRLAFVDPPPDRRVPPEPLRFLGGSVVLAALKRNEAAAVRGGRADPATRFVAGLPRRLGITVGR